jgi:endonuclease-3 related protein
MKKPNAWRIYEVLNSFYGASRWWPAETPFEVMVGAILTQQTNWSNVEKSIQQLKDGGLLDIKSLAKAEIGIIEKKIKQSGFYRQKARRIKLLADHIYKGYHGDLDEFFKKDADSLRSELLSLEGVGYETADSILLYADSKPKFVIDAYTFRIFTRLGKDFGGKYAIAQEFFESQLPFDVGIFRNYHAYLVELGKNFCKTKPQCRNCPLNDLCEFYLDKN